MKRQSCFYLFSRTSVPVAIVMFSFVRHFTDTCVGVAIISITAIIIIWDFIFPKTYTKITLSIPSKSYEFNVKLFYPLLQVKR